MKPSNFQFTNPSLLNLDYQINKDFAPNKNTSEIEVNFSTNCNIIKNEGSKEAIVELSISIGQKDNSVPFYISATEVAKFKWNDEVDNEILEILLNQNAPSLLLSYLRPLISTITSAGPVGSYNIPFMDFTKK